MSANIALKSHLLLACMHRETRKKIHYCLHMLAVVCVALGLWAAFASHSLKRPVPIPDLYSPHSFLGLATVILLGIQVRKMLFILLALSS